MDRDLKDIVAGCKAGSHSSYEALHKRFYRALLGIALRYGRSRDDAEDIVQETFIKVFEKINTYREDGPFESWHRGSEVFCTPRAGCSLPQ